MNDNPFLPPSSNLNARDSFSAAPDVSTSVMEGLARTKGWVRFCGIMMCIMFALVTLQFLLAVVGVNSMAGPNQSRAYALGTTFGGFVFGLLFYLWPAIRLLRYSKAIGLLLERRTAVELEEALNIQRGFWKHIGIITLIFLILFVVGMIGMIAFAGAMSQRH